tara:strand:- start:651 stop:1037 length:387 start_codon:yes stop_codon:yes gene_type:complete
LTGTRKIPLGSPVIIDTIKSKYNLKNNLNKEIALMPEGIVTSYCNELSNQFLIIKLRSNIEIKVSENELSECTINYYFPDKTHTSGLLKSINNFFRIEYILTGNREIKYLFNPLIFFKWIIYVLKDVF